MDSKFYLKMLNYVQEGIYFVDIDRTISFWNKGAEEITGFSSEEVIGSHCYDNILNHTDDNGVKLCHVGCPLHQTMTDGTLRKTDVYLHHKNGHRVPINVRSIPIFNEEEVIGAVEIFSDSSNTEEIFKNMKELKKLAMYDQLTCLPNRRFMEGIVKSKITEFETTGITFGVVFLDIDHFKKVNDTYGHNVGDEVLKVVAKTLDSTRDDGDYIGRWGGEEFVGVFNNCDVVELRRKAELMRILVENTSLRYTGEDISVTVSIGGKIVEDDFPMDKIVQMADDAMYESKKNGRNIVTIHDYIGK